MANEGSAVGDARAARRPPWTLFLVAPLLGLLAIPVAGSETPDAEALRSSLRAAEQAFARTVADGDRESFARWIAEDAVFSGSGEPLVGRDAIVEGWSGFFAPDGPRISWHPEEVSVLPDGSLGTTRGPYRVEGRGKDGGLRVAEGTFFSVWRRVDERWEVILDGGTEARPVAEAAAWPEPFAGLEWLAGRWVGEGLGGWIEESWGPPEGGAMLGSFRLVKEGRPVIYEIFALSEVEGKLVLRLKHFDSDLAGWEAKEETVDFRVASRTEGVLELEGLRYHREGEDGLVVEVDFEREDGISTQTLQLRRAGG